MKSDQKPGKLRIRIDLRMTYQNFSLLVFEQFGRICSSLKGYRGKNYKIKWLYSKYRNKENTS